MTFVIMFQGAAVQVFGPPAAFTEQERKFIEPSLTNILQRLPVRIASQVTMFLDPIMLAFGLGMWGMRMWKMETGKRQEEVKKDENVPVNREQSIPSDNERRNGTSDDTPLGVAPVPISILRAQVGGDGI